MGMSAVRRLFIVLFSLCLVGFSSALHQGNTFHKETIFTSQIKVHHGSKFICLQFRLEQRLPTRVWRAGSGMRL